MELWETFDTDRRGERVSMAGCLRVGPAAALGLALELALGLAQESTFGLALGGTKFIEPGAGDRGFRVLGVRGVFGVGGSLL